MMQLVAVLFGYIVGSVPFGLLAGRLRGVDIRRHGSGNIGTTNALRLLGPHWAALVLLLDAGKGFAAGFFASSLFGPGDPWIAALGGLSSIAGHNWSIFLRFDGGKGAATTLGVFLFLAPEVVPVALSITILSVILTRYMSLGSVLGVATGALLILTGNYSLAVRFAAVLAALWSLWQHRDNIGRLQRGEERRIGERPRSDDEGGG